MMYKCFVLKVFYLYSSLIFVCTSFIHGGVY